MKKETEADHQSRVAKRLQAVLLNHQGYSSGAIAQLRLAARSKVSEWLQRYEQYGEKALLEGQRSGCPPQLTQAQRLRLADLIDSGPRAYGFLSGGWSAPMIRRVIHQEFAVRDTARHVRRLLVQMDFSVQRPKPVLARADPKAQNRWRRYTYPNLKKNRRPARPISLRG